MKRKETMTMGAMMKETMMLTGRWPGTGREVDLPVAVWAREPEADLGWEELAGPYLVTDAGEHELLFRLMLDWWGCTTREWRLCADGTPGAVRLWVRGSVNAGPTEGAEGTEGGSGLGEGGAA